ncbi:MAG: alpha/beta hydrolase [Alphaproteobacteria bacterium]|nr:MAG: alpha/beta hydrolase [Alphaproteobacteria bacterium]
MTGDLPLYLVPGTMCDGRLWQPVTARLPGRETLLADYTAADSLAGMVDAVLKGAPARCHLVGFSLGGYLALAAALKAPERFRTITVIAASPYGLHDAEKTLRRQNAGLLAQARYRGMSSARLKQFVHPDHLADVSITDTIRQMEMDLGQDILLRQLTAPIERPDLSADLATLPAPVHFIMAEDDAMVPISAIETLAAKVPAIKLHRIKASGHMIPLEAPDALAAILDQITVEVC